MKKVLLVFALESEVIDVRIPQTKMRTLITGVGKLNAAIALTRAICEERPDAVINIGTAGSWFCQIGDILVCRHFADRDMQILPEFGLINEISFPSLETPIKLIGEGRVNTGSNFVEEGVVLKEDVVDMEAFALAEVCRQFEIPFVAVKYVTDIIGKNSVKHWQDKLSDARDALTDYFKNKTDEAE